MLKALNEPPGGLFWSAPLSTEADFAPEDPLALDYLGQQVGLWLFPGLTTRTNRTQYYAVVLYGLHLVERAVSDLKYRGDDKNRTRMFERWERFWAIATIEYCQREIEHQDFMRGVRGAVRIWFAGDQPLPLDYELISRQNELGGLGAYLSSLREYRLVFPGSLKVTPYAKPIIDAFWSEAGERAQNHLYEEYALKALDLDSNSIARKHGRISLAGIGKRSRLSSLANLNRNKQQIRLWERLFLWSRDNSTLPLAKRLISAHSEGVEEPEQLLEGFLACRWEALESDVANKVEVALIFGRVARVLLTRFDRAYEYVYHHSWMADVDTVADAAFPASEQSKLRILCKSLLNTSEAQRFRKLQFHGPEFLGLLTKIVQADSRGCLDSLLQYHRSVQLTRRGGGAWIRENKNNLELQVANYNGHKNPTTFPNFKLGVVRQLLTDLGQIK